MIDIRKIFKLGKKKKAEGKIEVKELKSDKEYRDAVIEAIAGAKKEVIIITNDFSEFREDKNEVDKDGKLAK